MQEGPGGCCHWHWLEQALSKIEKKGGSQGPSQSTEPTRGGYRYGLETSEGGQPGVWVKKVGQRGSSGMNVPEALKEGGMERDMWGMYNRPLCICSGG